MCDPKRGRARLLRHTVPTSAAPDSAPLSSPSTSFPMQHTPQLTLTRRRPQRESPWRTAYDQQFARSEAAAAAAAATAHEPRRAIPRRPGDVSFSGDPRPHVAMALREYG